MQMEIRFKKCGISNQQNVCIRDDPCLSKFGALSIADAGEFRFARFYIVYEEVPLGTPESPLIVCDLSDTLRECPNVEETRNSMQTFSWKKYSHFSPTNIPSTFPSEIPRCDLLIILLITSRGVAGLKWQPLIERYSRFRCFVMILAHTRYKMTMTMIE